MSNTIRGWTVVMALLVPSFKIARAQDTAWVSVTTGHNDIRRTGANLKETILTPRNVNLQQFGKLFTQAVKGEVSTQPLYVSKVPIAGSGLHNIVYVATYDDVVYAFDADSNGGVNASPLWQVPLFNNASTPGTYVSDWGVEGTPVIDLPSRTMYLVSSELQAGVALFRLHALDIRTGVEKPGAPVTIEASVAGTGTGSSAGTLRFDPQYQYQRPGLLLLNGVVYLAFGSVGDVGPWHGWLFSYDAATLRQIDVFCTTPNGDGGGIWMGGSGLAAEVDDSAKPFGRMFLATGNGSYPTGKPYTSSESYGMSVLDLDLTGGKMTVTDEFTPYDALMLDSQDGDLGSGGPILLPPATLDSGSAVAPLIEAGKSGMIYILDGNNLGGFDHGRDNVLQELQTPQSGTLNWGSGVWGTEAYWNGHVYYSGAFPGGSSSLAAYSFANGVLSATPTSASRERFSYPAPTPSISSNGKTDGVVWVLDSHAYINGGPEVLYAYDAANLTNLLYSSNADALRDAAGPATRFVVPTIANGKVYAGATRQLDVYGLLGSVPTAPPPVIAPASGTFSGLQTVSITDAVDHATIYYTTNGEIPTTASAVYTKPFKINASKTITAIASVTGYLQSSPSTATYTSTSNAANPAFSLAAGTYSGVQSLILSDSSSGAVIYYTIDGTTPTTASKVYDGPIPIRVSETVQAFATAAKLAPSSVVSAAYTLEPVYTIDFSHGFSTAISSGEMQFNGSTDLDDFRLQLTNGGLYQAGSAFYKKKVSVESFTTNFAFQLSNPAADGVTFTIQNDGPAALGGDGGGLGYAAIRNSVAIKFDIYNNQGEGPNSTGLYVEGNLPTVPAISLADSPIDLHSGDVIDAHLTYDGVTLTLTLTNPISQQTWSHSFTIDIPRAVGGDTAWVGFTGGTGSGTASQKFNSWTYVAGMPSLPNYPAGFDTAELSLTGAALAGTALELTNGGSNKISSAYFSHPVDIESFTTNMDFQLTDAVADGFTFVLQNAGSKAIGTASGGLGYATIPDSVAIKFDLFNNAGEGTDSTGVYVNGATPTIPAINLTPSGLSLASGHTIHLEITYNGTILNWKLQDLSASYPIGVQESLAVNIPHTIGSNTAYVGFTAASGDGTAVQKILDWTFINP